MDLNQRIEQFEHMCREDPDNDMAHFSLGNAYQQAGRFDDAAASFARCITLNPGLSKAYQLASECLIAIDRTDDAREILTEGYRTAASRGDVLPRDAMKTLLEQLGAPLPDIAPEQVRAIPEGALICGRTGRPGTPIEHPPFKGPLGLWIKETITQETWNDWIAQGTKVINELRLDLSQDADADVYDQHMKEYLGYEG
ncbi:MAG: Fe(2+)-trafficking protein [Phycisphaerales bacterium]|nr:Fe(2+)-trafficking protein [Phycisphaerales bacterium]